jgi:hypothetical protein
MPPSYRIQNLKGFFERTKQMTKATNLFVGLSLAAAMGAANANGNVKPPVETCKKDCGGTTPAPTTPAITVGVDTDISVAPVIKIESSPTAASESTAISGSTSGVHLESGAIAPVVNGGSVGDVKTGDNKNTLIGGSQTLIVKNKPAAASPTAPTVIAGQSGVAYGGKLGEMSAILACAAAPKSGSTWSAAVTTVAVGASLGRSPGVEGIDNSVKQVELVDLDGNKETVFVQSACVTKVQEEQAKARVYGSGPAGVALVVATDIKNTPELRSSLSDVREVADCAGDPTTNMIMGTCPKASTQVTETVKSFNAAGSGIVVPQQEVCPTGTPRAGKPALWNTQIQKFICG